MVITWQLVLAVAGGFVCIMGALREVKKVIEAAKKPGEDIAKKFANDDKRLNDIEKDMKEISNTLKYLIDSQNLQLENDKVILEHMRTNNSTGKIAEREDAIYKFLKKHQVHAAEA